MTLILAYNKSDITYGWDGRTLGFNLYYSHFTDAHINMENIVPLSDGLIPTVKFKTVKQTFLGSPYTACNRQPVPTNDYDAWHSAMIGYSQRMVEA